MNKRFVILFLIFFLAAGLRLYRLGAYTEFLGDQGRTGIIIWKAWMNKTLPLIGPPVLSGQHLGPFFYYFMALPFILSNFHPLAPALWMAMFGVLSVFLVFHLGEKIFSLWIGSALAVLYAISPNIVSSDRTLWEPNIIPFFVLLYIFFIYLIYERRLFAAFLPLGIIVGILVQLHYPNVFFIILSFLFFLFLLVTKRSQESLCKIFCSSLLGVFGFLVVLSPFLYYEMLHAWTDVKGILSIFFSSGSSVSKRAVLYAMSDYSFRLFYTMVSIGKREIMTLVKFGIIGAALIKRKFWGVFFGLWFIAGVTAMCLYKGIVFDHYLNFLLPLPFFLFGAVIHEYHRYIPRFFWVILVILGIYLQAQNLIGNFEPKNDIARTRDMVSVMERLSGGKPFSFTLVSSISFSDLHYRYFFLTDNIQPLPIVNKSYNALYLICEKLPCRTFKEMNAVQSVKAICYDEYCSGEYPAIDLTEWQLVATYDGFDGRMYIYRRKSLLNT